MATWVWIIIVVAIVVVLGAVALAARSKRRSRQLQDLFGPEYDRAVNEAGGRRRADSELDARRERREKLDIRALAPGARQRYAGQWKDAQGHFVDDPKAAVQQADILVISVMRERGYPMENFDQRSADVSVDHPHVVEDYRAAHGISMANDHGRASTEDLRQAMVHYRSLFEELLSEGDGEAEVQREAR